MKIKKTSFAVTRSALDFEKLILSYMDIKRTTFHRKMIDYYFKNQIRVHPYLLISDKTDPHYIRKKAVEQIYLDSVREEKIQKEAEMYGCRTGVILFQAMMSYCLAVAPEVLGTEELGKLFNVE